MGLVVCGKFVDIIVRNMVKVRKVVIVNLTFFLEFIGNIKIMLLRSLRIRIGIMILIIK